MKGMRGFSFSAYCRSRAAAERRRIRENEKYWRDIHKLQEKQLRELRRQEEKDERARLRVIREAEQKKKKAEALAKLEARIEARLRKQLGMKECLTLDKESRLLEPMEGCDGNNNNTTV